MRAKETIKISRTHFSTVGTILTSERRINEHNLLTENIGFVFNELSQLKETPTMQPSIESFASSDIPYSFQVFHYDNICSANYLFAHNMVVVPHETFLSATQLFQASLGRFCAFTLQPSSQVVELFYSGFWGFENLAIATDSEIIYSEVNAQNLVATRSWSVDLSGESDVKKNTFLFYLL